MSQEIIEDSLMRVAETSGDISPLVYERFYKASAVSEGLMSHIDDLARGKMMEEIIRLLLVEDMSAEAEYLDFEVKTHREAYSVTEDMYEPLMQAVLSAIREGDDQWTDEVDAAWQQRISAVMNSFRSRFVEGAGRK